MGIYARISSGIWEYITYRLISMMAMGLSYRRVRSSMGNCRGPTCRSHYLLFFSLYHPYFMHIASWIAIFISLLDCLISEGGWCEKTRRYLQFDPAISQDFPASSQYFPWFPAIKKKRPAELVSTAALSQGFNGPVQ